MEVVGVVLFCDWLWEAVWGIILCLSAVQGFRVVWAFQLLECVSCPWTECYILLFSLLCMFPKVLAIQGLHSDLWGPVLAFLYLRNAHIWQFALFFLENAGSLMSFAGLVLSASLWVGIDTVLFEAPLRVASCSRAPPAVTSCKCSPPVSKSQDPSRSQRQNLRPSRCYLGCQISVLVLSVQPPLAP